VEAADRYRRFVYLSRSRWLWRDICGHAARLCRFATFRRRRRLRRDASVVVVVFSFLLPAIISGPRACPMRPSALPVYNFRRRGVGGLVGTAGRRTILTTLGMKSISVNCIGRSTASTSANYWSVLVFRSTQYLTDRLMRRSLKNHGTRAQPVLTDANWRCTSTV